MTILHNPAAVPEQILSQVPQANHNLESYRSAIAGGSSSNVWLENFFGQADVIFLLYPSEKKPGGLGMLIAKGQHLLEAGIADERAIMVKTGSLVVGCGHEAIIAGIVYGDIPEPKWLRKASAKTARRLAAARKGRS